MSANGNPTDRPAETAGKGRRKVYELLVEETETYKVIDQARQAGVWRWVGRIEELKARGALAAKSARSAPRYQSSASGFAAT